MIRHLSLLNPFVAITDTARARAAARAGAVGLGLSALAMGWSIVSAALWPERLQETMRTAMAAQPAGQDPEFTRFMDAMMPGLINMSLVMNLCFGIVLIVLAVIQWRTLTRMIPLLFLMFTIFGALSSLMSLAAMQSGLMPRVPLPMAQMAFAWVVMIVQLALYTVAFRGASFLEREKVKAAA
jgi:vacuolar-type H+-ATPase subunit I/STV1